MKALRLGIVLPLLTLAACAWWMAGRPGLAALDQLTFSHTLHIDEGVECDTCHEGVAEATDTSSAHRPAEEVCLECHEREDNCDMCHSDAENAGKRPAHSSDLGFSHAAHIERVGDEGCAKCHPAVDWDEAPVPLPNMDSCLECHNHDQDYARAECLHCHPSLRAKPLRAIAEFDHAGDWMSRHGLQARNQGAACQQCHTDSTCSECHSRVAPAVNAQLFPEAVGRNLLHRGDFRSTHAMEARADGDTCLRCHHTNYCAQCHEQHGLTAGVSNGRIPHPPGWSTPGGAAFHGDEARLRIETCAACHDQGAASNCVTCHKVGSIGGNPHPRGWRADDYDENPMCQTCHAP
jgi:hypothetical protein